MAKTNQIPKNFKDFFIEPILKIDPFSEDHNKLRKTLLEDILENKIIEAKDILKQFSADILNLKIKKDLINYLYSKCPKKNHFPVTSFRQNLHQICQYVIRNVNGLDPTFVNHLNDISIEYYANHFDIYSIKIYQKKGSLRELMDNTEYILERYTGKIGSVGATYGGLGTEYHDIHTLEPTIKNEVKIYIYFNLNDPEYHNHNNIYFVFWSIGSNLKLWDDISSSTINRITHLLEEFFDEPNLEIKNLNTSTYFKKTALPDKIIDVIESSQLRDLTLKYDRIIERNIIFKDNRYNEIISEINGTYRKKYFTAMYILIRKLLENLMIDCLRNNYSIKQPNKYFNKDIKQFHVFEILKKNFNAMKDEEDFIRKVSKIDQFLIDVLDNFKDIGNLNAHSLFNLPHHQIIEKNKTLLNVLIKRLIEIKNQLK